MLPTMNFFPTLDDRPLINQFKAGSFACSSGSARNDPAVERLLSSLASTSMRRRVRLQGL
jgi:hypothetical protein